MDGLATKEAALLISSDNAAQQVNSSRRDTSKLLGYFKGEDIRAACPVSSPEPPRVRAILGAIGQQLGKSSIFCRLCGKPQSTLSL